MSDTPGFSAYMLSEPLVSILFTVLLTNIAHLHGLVGWLKM